LTFSARLVPFSAADAVLPTSRRRRWSGSAPMAWVVGRFGLARCWQRATSPKAPPATRA
jgi:hypothetical protein